MRWDTAFFTIRSDGFLEKYAKYKNIRVMEWF